VKFQLTSYQTDASADVIGSLKDGYARFTKSRKLTAVALSAPTGAGKTVIATAVIERLMYGDEAIEPNPNLTVLWVTDDPSLNVQTKRKMLLSSSHIRPGQLVTVDPTLDQKVLDPGKVYFVHIQQLGKGATSYVKVGNKRQYSLWETIGNTITTSGDNFLLIVDEAHRGTGSKPGGGKTITAQLMDGAGGSFPPTPVVLGISATPQRFANAISKVGQRTLEPVTVDPDSVRQSGLIKDKLRIKHPTETQPSDSTLLELAVEDLKAYDDLWLKYSTDQDEPLVRPVLVIQVKPKVSEKDLRLILDTLKSTWSILDGKAVGHAFQEHTTLNVGARAVRYIAPQDIQDDPHLRVVLFKEALTTGWDCPRAEVMISLRVAQDYTYIAQLIGRMVRTPLARRIATDDVLNTVALYLPYFDDDQIAEVVKGLQSDDSQITSEAEIDSVVCAKNSAVPAAVWKALAGVPTYTRPGRYHRNDVVRLNALAMLLVGNKLDDTAIHTARKHLTDTLAREAARLGVALDKAVADLEKLQYQTQSVDLATGAVERESASVAVNAQNIDDLFRRSRRTLGDAAAKWYWDVLCDDGMDPDEAKIRVAALASDPSVALALESASKILVDTWRTQHNGAIGNLLDAKRAQFYEIWQQAKAPEQVALIMPSQITAAGAKVEYEKHLYAHRGKYPATLTGWEADALKAELAKETLVGWYRNPTGGTAAVAVPYIQSGIARTMYPDFVFFHRVDGEIVIDIVDPHRPNQADAGPKWTGLAKYGKDHGEVFRRVVGVIKNLDGALMSLDLKNPSAADEMAKASTETDIRNAFDTYGGSY
jgi:type III restriction enzyme